MLETDKQTNHCLSATLAPNCHYLFVFLCSKQIQTKCNKETNVRNKKTNRWTNKQTIRQLSATLAQQTDKLQHIGQNKTLQKIFSVEHLLEVLKTGSDCQDKVFPVFSVSRVLRSWSHLWCGGVKTVTGKNNGWGGRRMLMEGGRRWWQIQTTNSFQKNMKVKK